jgi:hypothetical protein
MTSMIGSDPRPASWPGTAHWAHRAPIIDNIGLCTHPARPPPPNPPLDARLLAPGPRGLGTAGPAKRRRDCQAVQRGAASGSERREAHHGRGRCGEAWRHLLPVLQQLGPLPRRRLLQVRRRLCNLLLQGVRAAPLLVPRVRALVAAATARSCSDCCFATTQPADALHRGLRQRQRDGRLVLAGQQLQPVRPLPHHPGVQHQGLHEVRKPRRRAAAVSAQAWHRVPPARRLQREEQDVRHVF